MQDTFTTVSTTYTDSKTGGIINDKCRKELKQKKYILSSRESEIEILQSLLEKE